MIKFKNTQNYNQIRQKLLGGNVTGIWGKDQFFVGSNSYPIMNYHYITAQFDHFEKHLFSNDFSVNYHLSGYGTTYNEALTSFLGESSERYAFTLLYENIKSTIKKLSYSILKDTYLDDLIPPLTILNSYFTKVEPHNYLSEDDVICWVPLNSLKYLGKKVWVPLQVFAMLETAQIGPEKRFANSSVSTGTASHEDFEHSLKNALIEILQIDSFNLWWYGGIKGEDVEVNLKEKLDLWFEGQSMIERFLEKFNVKFTDITFDKPITTIVCEIFAKDLKVDLPKYVVGVQGGFDFENCLYRGFMECLTVLEYVMTVVWAEPNNFINIPQDISLFTIDNLDDNVLYYAKYGKQNLLENNTFRFKPVSQVQDLSSLITAFTELSEYAGFLDITPVEFLEKNLVVTRVYAPELLPISIPSYPPYHHERYQEIGGIFNDVPHPLA